MNKNKVDYAIFASVLYELFGNLYLKRQFCKDCNTKHTRPTPLKVLVYKGLRS